MRTRLSLAALSLLALLAWVLWPEDPAALPSRDSTAVQTEPEAKAAKLPEEAQTPPDEALGPAQPPADAAPPESEQRLASDAGLHVRGSVLHDGSQALFARLVYAPGKQLEQEDWFFLRELKWTKPKPIESDGSFEFRGPFQAEFADFTWRVEVGPAAQEGDEMRGSTPLLCLAASEPFSISPGLAVELAPMATEPPIELRVPLHDWHLIPSESASLSGEFKRRPEAWHGKPSVSFSPKDAPRLTRTIRLSPLHQGREFRVVARCDARGLDEPSHGEWLKLQPGAHDLAVLRPIPMGMLEIFLPNSRALFPPSLDGTGFSQMSEIRLARFQARTRGNFESRFLINPERVEIEYDPNWGTAPEPGGAWQGDTYVARIGWVEAGTWSVAAESRHIQRFAVPTEVEIPPFDVTRITMQWLGPGSKIRLIPQPPGEAMDDYVLSTWAVLGEEQAHVYRQGLNVQHARDLLIPPQTEAVVSVSHWHGEPTADGRPGSRISYLRGEMAQLRKPPENAGPTALAELDLYRANTSHILEFPLDPNIKGYHLGELRGRSGLLDGQAVSFTVSGLLGIELAGFPPGFYDVRLAPYSPGSPASEFQAWQTIEIRNRPNPAPPGSTGEGN